MRGTGWAWLKWPLASLAAMAASPAQAAGGASCALTATPLAFGRYVPSRNAPSDFTATLTLTCTVSGTASAPVEGTISLIGAGGHSGRELADGPNRLRYQLFMDPARTIPWGDGTGGTRTSPVSGAVGPATALRRTITVYGRVLARQPGAKVGNYTGQVTGVLNY